MGRLRSRRFWLGCIAAWATLTLTEGSALHVDALRAGRDSTLPGMLLDRAAANAIWIAIVAGVFLRMERLIARKPRISTLLGHCALLCVAQAPVYLLWSPAARTVLHGETWAFFVRQLRGTAGTTYLWDVFLFSMAALAAAVILTAQHARQQERDAAELKARLAHAELELLRAQLEPHFLFNALNTIAGMIRAERPDRATAALAKLSELLRYVVEASRQDRVPLAWELDFATAYLELQQMRYGARMQFEIHQSAGRGCDVPPLLLQPLIENAVVHGVARTSEPASISVHVTQAADALRVEVDNSAPTRSGGGARSGPGPAKQVWMNGAERSGVTHPRHARDIAGTGVGLRNTRQRLERMYGAAFELSAGPDGADRYRVTIALPHPVAQA